MCVCEFICCYVFITHTMSNVFCLFNVDFYVDQLLFMRLRQPIQKKKNMSKMHCKNAIVNKCQEGTNQFNDTLMVQISILYFELCIV